MLCSAEWVCCLRCRHVCAILSGWCLVFDVAELWCRVLAGALLHVYSHTVSPVPLSLFLSFSLRFPLFTEQSLNEITAVLGSHSSLYGSGSGAAGGAFLEAYRSPLLELLLELQDVDVHAHLAAHAEGAIPTMTNDVRVRYRHHFHLLYHDDAELSLNRS